MERAKQFMPFDALSGLREALQEKETKIIEQRELTNDELDSLNYVFNKLKKGDTIKIEYYKVFKYEILTGIITNINISSRIIKVLDIYIPFDDIISIVKIY